MRRLFLLCSTLCFVSFTSACNESDTPKRIADAHTHAEELQTQVDELNSRIDELRSEVDRFDSDNWKDVVPDVRSKLLQVESDGAVLTNSAEALTADLERLEADTTPSDDNDY